MNNGSKTLFTPYGSVNITFRYGDLQTLTRNAPETVPAQLRMLSTDSSPPPGAPTPQASSLSPRQGEVLRLLVQGRSNKEIARTLGLAIGTVKIHVGVLFHKLGVTSRTAAAVTGARLLVLQNQPSTSRSGAGPVTHAAYPLGPSNLDVAA